MRIKKLRLKNGYKRFYDLTIDLGEIPARIVALIGPNGCGKSSVLDGLLFHGNAYDIIGSKGRKPGEYHSMTQVANFDWQNVEIAFDQGSYANVREKKHLLGKEKTIFSFRSSYRYNSSLNVTETRSIADIKLNQYGASSASDIDEKMEQNYRLLNTKYNRYLHQEDCKPSEAKNKIIGDLNDCISTCIDLEISSLGDVQASRGKLYFKKSDHLTEFDFNVLSSGEKEVVDILLDLYLRQDEYDDTVFLIDEPELHISTQIQAKLLVEINRLVGSNCQIWFTTHSIGFMRAIQDNFREVCQVIHFRGEYELASKPYVLTPVALSTVTWRDLFEIALDDLAKLVCPKRLVYCEGRERPGVVGAERGLDARILNAVFSIQHSDTLFISSGGNTELDQRSDVAIAILGKVLPSLEIWVLKDRDMASGRLTTENDRQVYLRTNANTHRVLKRWEIENYLYDKEVLKAYCAANSLVFDEPRYDGLVTDIVNQNLKDETGKIKNICGIIGSISPDQFKLGLATCVTPHHLVYRELEACVFDRA